MKRYFIYSVTFLAALQSYAQDAAWPVPGPAAARTSPFIFSQQSMAKGQALYSKNCQQCHGEPTKGNFVLLNPAPGDPAGETFQKETDGGLFYKITNGRGAMLAFKDVLSEDDRWNIISFIRSFHKGYVQPPVGQGMKKAAQAWMLLRADTSLHKIFVRARGIKAGDTIPVRNASVTLYAKRYFGYMKAGRSQLTDSSGTAVFTAPNDLPGDKNGVLEFMVRISDDKDFGEFNKEISAPLGIPSDKPSLTDQRAMWGQMKKAPVWLYAAYVSVVGLIWAFILYIIYNLIRIRKIGLKK